MTASTYPDRERLVTNVFNHVKKEVAEEVGTRVTIDYWRKVDDELGAHLAKGMG